MTGLSDLIPTSVGHAVFEHYGVLDSWDTISGVRAYEICTDGMFEHGGFYFRVDDAVCALRNRYGDDIEIYRYTGWLASNGPQRKLWPFKETAHVDSNNE
jgi:hypothetical protein